MLPKEKNKKKIKIGPEEWNDFPRVAASAKAKSKLNLNIS